MKKYFFAILVFLVTTANAQAPSPTQFLGYELGTHFTPHYKIVEYFKAAAQASPTIMKLEQYGTTTGGRPLLMAIISSPENISNLETIRLNNMRLTGLETGRPDLTSPKAVVWLSYNVHGNEPSSSEAAMMTLNELLNPTKTGVRDWLKNTVVIIDPCINPDGRDRYVNWFNSVAGAIPNPDPQSQEHVEPWPQGRVNFYNFDLNRDWAWQTQKETQQRMAVYQKWMPQIHCDYHEQGYNQPYYFAPAAEPFHEVITPWQRDFQYTIGRNHAGYFDANGWLYFTKERFDLFYPSYGDTWPLYNGSIGMTYEQGGHSRGGLAVITADGDTLTLRDRVMHHYTTGISTIETASKNAGKLVENFKKYFDDANKNGVGDYKTFVIPTAGNEPKLADLKKLLDRNLIKYQYSGAGSANGFNYNTGKSENYNLQRGDLIISTMQPKGALVKVLFEPVSKLVDSATYDITAWSIPYAYGLNAFAVKEKLSAVSEAVREETNTRMDENAYGYAVQWNGLASAQFISEMLQQKIRFRVSAKPFESGKEKFAAGTLLLLRGANNGVEKFGQTVAEAAKKYNLKAVALTTGFMDKGADFGSPDVQGLTMPKVACLTGRDADANAAGEVWFHFEQELHYPLTLINAADAANADLKKFDVLIVPNGYYRSLLTKDGAIKQYVQQGGTLIIMENAVNTLADNDWGLTAKKASEDSGKPNVYANLRKFANAERDGLVEANPGSIFKMELDNTHPLAFGYPDYYYTLKQDDVVYNFLESGWNVGVIKKGSQVAGFTGVKAKQKLQDGVLFGQFGVGRGSVIFFADNPLFRSFWQNGKLLFDNAVFMASGRN
jgi:hypothetical protein